MKALTDSLIAVKRWVESWLQSKNEDEGHADHLVGQKEPPFYCGTAFCGHGSKKAARECWRKKCSAIKTILIEAEALRRAGKNDEAVLIERSIDAYYPERNPSNWPINRSSAEMRAEYEARKGSES